MPRLTLDKATLRAVIEAAHEWGKLVVVQEIHDNVLLK
jgi:hypothetical protein